jgi:hypothetical protein
MSKHPADTNKPPRYSMAYIEMSTVRISGRRMRFVPKTNTQTSSGNQALLLRPSREQRIGTLCCLCNIRIAFSSIDCNMPCGALLG